MGLWERGRAAPPQPDRMVGLAAGCYAVVGEAIPGWTAILRLFVGLYLATAYDSHRERERERERETCT
jgi:hypothetical protein